MSHGILHYLWLADISKSFSEMILSIFTFSQYFINSFCQCLSFRNIFFNRFCPVEKCGVTPHCLYRDSLTLTRKIGKCERSSTEMQLEGLRFI